MEELWASAWAMLPARSDSDVERCPPSFCLSLSFVRFLADFEVPAFHNPSGHLPCWQHDQAQDSTPLLMSIIQLESMVSARPGLWWLTWQGGKVLCSEVAASAAAGSCQVVARAAESRPLPLRFCSVTQKCVVPSKAGRACGFIW